MIAVGRKARGLKDELCGQCRTGVAPGQVKLFTPDCEGCLAKKAAGLRTGNEPRPTHRGGEQWIDHKKLAKQKEARARAMAALPRPRWP